MVSGPQVHESEVGQERNLRRNETEGKLKVPVEEAESKTRLQGQKMHKTVWETVTMQWFNCTR